MSQMHNGKASGRCLISHGEQSLPHLAFAGQAPSDGGIPRRRGQPLGLAHGINNSGNSSSLYCGMRHVQALQVLLQQLLPPFVRATQMLRYDSRWREAAASSRGEEATARSSAEKLDRMHTSDVQGAVAIDGGTKVR
jgi:hypothetical protein